MQEDLSPDGTPMSSTNRANDALHIVGDNVAAMQFAVAIPDVLPNGNPLIQQDLSTIGQNVQIDAIDVDSSMNRANSLLALPDPMYSPNISLVVVGDATPMIGTNDASPLSPSPSTPPSPRVKPYLEVDSFASPTTSLPLQASSTHHHTSSCDDQRVTLLFSNPTYRTYMGLDMQSPVSLEL